MRPIVAALVLLAAAPPAPAQTFAVTVVAVDSLDRPIAKAEVAAHWQSKAGRMEPFRGVSTGPDGRAVVRLDADSTRPVMVLSADRSLGGFAAATKADAGKELRVVLKPTVKVKGALDCPELGRKPEWANVYVQSSGPRDRFAQCTTTDGSFSFTLPPGDYAMMQYGTDIETKRAEPLELDGTRSEVDLGTCTMTATPVGKLKGKPAPELAATAARGAKPDAKLADYKGKWVLLDFWHFDCGPCVESSLPEAVAFQTLYAAHAERFVILSVHSDRAKSFAELDPKLPAFERQFFGGKPLPFPILIDGDGRTAERYGIDGFPTAILIDPAGKLVGESSFGDLAKKLPAVPVSEAWAVQRDRHECFSFDFYRDRPNPWAGFAERLSRATYCEVELDAAAFTGVGLDAAGDIPGAVSGRPNSWRSCAEIYLAPHGLGVVPSADGKKLRITKCPPVANPPSALQLARNADLAARLGQPVTPLAINDVPLAGALQLLRDEYGVALALDPKAVLAKAIDPAAKVTAAFGNGTLGDGLAAMLAPLGLRHGVRCEIIWVTGN